MATDLTVVVGGGAAGICAAISTARMGRSVVICEKTSQIGKKILATGNGRCNLLNDDLAETYYNATARQLVKSVIARFGKRDILDFFKALGLRTYSLDGRIFPITNQAASVLKVLDLELKRLGIPIALDFNCSGLSSSGDNITVSSDSGKRLQCRKVILTGGGKSYPALGSDGSAYELAASIGHNIIAPVPSAVPLVVKDTLCHFLQGQRIQAGVRSMIDGAEGEEVRGELLFTKYGLSGTCILDISRQVSIALNRNRRTNVALSVDLVPLMSSHELSDELQRRKNARLSPEDMLVGVLPNKFGGPLRAIFAAGDIDRAVAYLKARKFQVSSTRGWNEAEFTAGGIDVKEVQPATLQSKLHKWLYFAGEVLDVDGERGGFNLGWAWASGWVAGIGE